jgi:hypothetical protein
MLWLLNKVLDYLNRPTDWREEWRRRCEEQKQDQDK